MKFIGLRIEKDYGKDADKFRGTLIFDTEAKDTFYLHVDDNFSKQVINICLPILKQATNEKIEIIKKEL